MTASPSPARRYGGKTLEQRLSERRERLLDAGLELFGTRGYANTTIEQICSTAHLNPRYFYEQFASREALLRAVYERHVQGVVERVADALERAPREPLARLVAGLRAFLDGSLADERAARINYFEVVGVSPELERRRRRVLAAYAEIIAGQIELLASTAPLELSDRRLTGVALGGAVDGLVIDWLSGGRAQDRESIVTTLVELLGPVLSPPR